MLPSQWEFPAWGPLPQAILGLIVLISVWILIAVRLGWIGKNGQQIHGRMFPIDTGVWIGQIHIDVSKLETDLFFIISFVAYNGTTKFISIGAVQGVISCNGVALPEPKLLPDRNPIQNLPAAKEFMVTIEQRVPKNVADDILKRLAEKNHRNRMQCDVSKLNIFAFFPSDTQHPTRLPIWNFTVDMEGTPPRAMRSSSLVMNLKERRDDL